MRFFREWLSSILNSTFRLSFGRRLALHVASVSVRPLMLFVIVPLTRSLFSRCFRILSRRSHAVSMGIMTVGGMLWIIQRVRHNRS